MIYPTRRAVLIVAAGAPVALAFGLMGSVGWVAGPVWVAGVLLLAVADALVMASRAGLTLDEPVPPRAAIARPGQADVFARFGKGWMPPRAEAAMAADTRLGLMEPIARAVVADRRAAFVFPFVPERRGDAMLRSLWVRWQGPLGLIWKQKTFALDVAAPVLVDLQSVRDDAVRLFARNALFGAKTQIELGEGSEFQALRDFQPGMDRRAIDWKQSARHAALLAKEFRTERNHHVIMALDCGRAMSEPVGARRGSIGRSMRPCCCPMPVCGPGTGWGCSRSTADRASRPARPRGWMRSGCCSGWRGGSTIRLRRPTTPWG